MQHSINIILGKPFTRFILGLFVIIGLGASGWAQVVYHTGTTRKVLQLTNGYDTALRRNTVTRTQTNHDIGTDLGSSFMHNGRLWFAFGDTAGAPDWGDTLSYTTATRIGELNNLNFRTNPDASIKTVDVPGITEVGMEVASGAIDVDGAIYLVQTTEWDPEPYGNMRKSVMARSTNDGDTWTNLYTLSDDVNHDMTNAHFINVSMRKVNAADYNGQLPWSSGEVVLIWGTGAYRKSNVYLACIPAASIATKSALRYLSGVDANNVPAWSTTESAAIPLFIQPTLGEFSAGWIPQQNCWMVLYAGGDYGGALRGIQMRTAAKPWGPYSSKPTTIMTPGGTTGDDAYGRYMHISWDPAQFGSHLDQIQDYIMGGDNTWGGEYGGYLIENFTTGDATNTQIYYTVSTWNPYQVVVLKSEIGPATITAPPPSSIPTLPLDDASWNKSSSTFYQAATVGGVKGINTWTAAQGDAATGIMWRWLPRDQWNKSLAFKLTGGNAEVILIEGGGEIPTTGNIATIYNNIKSGVYGDVVQCTWGHSSNDIVIPITWKLSSFDRANLKVVIIDKDTAWWNFVQVSDMTLTRNDPSWIEQSTSKIMPGDSAWTKTAGAWYDNVLHNGVSHITTYAAAGAADQGLMWRMLPRDWKNKRLQFTCHGGHGEVLLLQGGDAIPTSGDFATIYNDIRAGKYGQVRESVVGPDSNDVDMAVDWDLTRHKSDDLKLVVIDSLTTSPWGFISVSRMTLTRFEKAVTPTNAVSGPWLQAEGL